MRRPQRPRLEGHRVACIPAGRGASDGYRGITADRAHPPGSTGPVRAGWSMKVTAADVQVRSQIVVAGKSTSRVAGRMLLKIESAVLVRLVERIEIDPAGGDERMR